jgi:predicted ester cyclase
MTPTVALDDSDRLASNLDLVRRFYAAVNDALRTGDTAPLDSLVAPDFVDQIRSPGAASTRAGLAQHVQSLQTVFPDLQLTVLDLVAQNDRVLARVGLAGSARGSFLGLPVTQSGAWGSVDVFRIQAGRIVEHDGEVTGLNHWEKWASAPILLQGATGAARKEWSLTRRTYEPTAGDIQVSEDGPTLLWLESGEVTIELDDHLPGPAQRFAAGSANQPLSEPVAPGESTALRPGDWLVIPTFGTFATRNDGRSAASLLSVSFATVWTGARDTALVVATDRATGVVSKRLAGGAAVFPTVPAMLSLGRISLGRDRELPLHRVAGLELLGVVTGELAITVGDGEVHLQTPTQGLRMTRGTATVTANQAILATSNALVGYRNGGADPLVAFVVTIQIAEPVATWEPASPAGRQ